MALWFWKFRFQKTKEGVITYTTTNDISVLFCHEQCSMKSLNHFEFTTIKNCTAGFLFKIFSKGHSKTTLTTFDPPTPSWVDNCGHFTEYLHFVYVTKHGLDTDYLPTSFVHTVFECIQQPCGANYTKILTTYPLQVDNFTYYLPFVDVTKHRLFTDLFLSM